MENTVKKGLEPKTPTDMIKVTVNEFKSPSPGELHTPGHRKNLEDVGLRIPNHVPDKALANWKCVRKPGGNKSF